MSTNNLGLIGSSIALSIGIKKSMTLGDLERPNVTLAGITVFTEPTRKLLAYYVFYQDDINGLLLLLRN